MVSILIFMYLLFSINNAVFAQKKAKKDAPLNSSNLAKIGNIDTLKVILVNSGPITVTVIKDSAATFRNDTIAVKVVNSNLYPKRWVYKHYYVDTQYNAQPNLEELNRYGAEGWDLAQALFLKDAILIILKKPL